MLDEQNDEGRDIERIKARALAQEAVMRVTTPERRRRRVPAVVGDDSIFVDAIALSNGDPHFWAVASDVPFRNACAECGGSHAAVGLPAAFCPWCGAAVDPAAAEVLPGYNDEGELAKARELLDDVRVRKAFKANMEARN